VRFFGGVAVGKVTLGCGALGAITRAGAVSVFTGAE
jgi:hypothetical protein